MRTIIDDLEALKELNDELEEGHMESEKQLSEEIGMCHPPLRPYAYPFADQITLQLRDERIRSNDLEAVILDMEATLSQFRDLVSSLQR